MKIKPFKAMCPNMDMVDSPIEFFNMMKYDYTSFVKDGIFIQRPEPAFYIYRIISKKRIQTGIIAGVDIKDIIKNNVKRHEETLAVKEQRLTQILLEREALIKPVLLGFDKSVKGIKKYIKKIISSDKPYFEFDFEETNEKHQLWEISKPKQIKKLKRIFKKNMSTVYIADGHHRCSTTTKMYQSKTIKTNGNGKTVLAAFFNFEELVIHDFYRIVDIFSTIVPSQFNEELLKYCSVRPLKKIQKPKKKHTFNMCINGQWSQVSWKRSTLKRHKKRRSVLDVDLFNLYILKKILKVKDIRDDKRIEYIDGYKTYKDIKEITIDKNLVGFSLYPLTAKDIIITADADEMLPPKSSFFEPRIKNGMIVKKLKMG